MATVILTGWRRGMRKISLTMLQRELLALLLKQAKDNTDRVLEAQENAVRSGQPITLEVPNALVSEFVKRATSLGALVEVTAPNSHPTQNTILTPNKRLERPFYFPNSL